MTVNDALLNYDFLHLWTFTINHYVVYLAGILTKKSINYNVEFMQTKSLTFMLKANMDWTLYLSELLHHKTATSLQTSNKKNHAEFMYMRSLQLIRQVITLQSHRRNHIQHISWSLWFCVVFFLTIWHALYLLSMIINETRDQYLFARVNGQPNILFIC